MAEIKCRVKDEVGAEQIITLEKLPDECPISHHGIDPRILHGYYELLHTQIIFQCPRNDCHSLFIGYYAHTSRNYRLKGVSPTIPQKREFSKEIKNVSENFMEIYNQALIAENKGLSQVSGPGYRKALEFLIKDYAIINEADVQKHETIKKMFLGRVIKEYVTDSNVKTTAELASWLGNDETHYVKLWSEMDIGDLKTLIELTVHWIESNELTKSYKEKMKVNSARVNQITAG